MKTIAELIQEGYEIKERCIQKGYVGHFISGEEYETWLMYCTRYLQSYGGADPQVQRFIEVAKKANGNDDGMFETLIGILKSLEAIPIVKAIDNIDYVLEKICLNFHRCTKSILNRHAGRETLEIKDEYDVQDLLQGILRLFIDDVRPEDYVPSYAGGNSRTDFYLPLYDTYIETKMTRAGLHDKEVGEELSIDIARYGDKCKKLVCFIYDKNNELQNPYGLIGDLEKLGADRVEVKVFISPL